MPRIKQRKTPLPTLVCLALSCLLPLSSGKRSSLRPWVAALVPPPALAMSRIATSCSTLVADPWRLFHPAWGQQSFDLTAVPTPSAGEANIPFLNVSALVDDPQNRIETAFRVPPYLRSRVIFWMQVHAIYNRQMRIIHDRRDLSVVYGYLDLRPYLRACGESHSSIRRSRQIERAIKRELRDRIAEVGGLTRSHHMGRNDREALRDFLVRHTGLDATIVRQLLGGIRTQTGQRDEFRAALERSSLLLPHIESEFRRNGLPAALARIPFVESSFNPRAHSKAGAVGIWQFMPHTARQMLHTRNRKVWADPLQETVGAVRVLKRYRAELPDWSTVVTAYNSGFGRMRRLVHRHRATNIGGLLDLPRRQGLGFAGKNFYAQFLSANLVEAYKEMLFRTDIEPVDYLLVVVAPREHGLGLRSPAAESAWPRQPAGGAKK